MIASFLTWLFSGVAFYFVLAAFGATAGLCIAFVGERSRWAAAGLCAAVLVCVQLFGVLDRFSDARAQAEITALKAENKAKAGKIDELTVTNASLNDFLDEERIVAQSNAETLARVSAKLDAMEDRPGCAIPKDILDELDQIR